LGEIMREEVHNPPIISLLSAIKGFLGGGFMALAIFTDWDPVGRTVLFVIGLIAVLDSVMPVDRKLYAATTMFFLIVGGLMGFFTALSGSGLAYLVLLLAVAIVVYLDKIRRMYKTSRQR